MFYVNKVCEKYDELVDVFDTCQYLSKNGVGSKNFSASTNNGRRVLQCAFIGTSTAGLKIILLDNKRVSIYMNSNGYGMGEGCYLSETTTDYEIDYCMKTESSLGCTPYKERLDKLVAELPQRIDEFFEYVDNL